MSNSKTGFDSKLYAKYASLKDPKEKLPKSIYYWHTERTLTVLEQFPKSKIHVIMIPRVGAPPRVPANMRNLCNWLTSSEVSKSDAQGLLLDMRRDLDELLLKLKEEMEYSYEYVGNFWAGFKADPSYKYLHMHVMSDDLCGSNMKLPRHFFSFDPEHGEFYPLDEVLSWFEIVQVRYEDHLEELRQKKQSLRYRKEEEDVERRHEYHCYHRDDGVECPVTTRDFSSMKDHLAVHANKAKELFMRRKRAREERERKKAERQAREEAEAQRRESGEQAQAHDEPMELVS